MAYAEDCKSCYTGSIPVPASKKDLFQRSSVVEQSAVNRSVVGSSPTAGAIKRDPFWGLFFYAFYVGKKKPLKIKINAKNNTSSKRWIPSSTANIIKRTIKR